MSIFCNGRSWILEFRGAEQETLWNPGPIRPLIFPSTTTLGYTGQLPKRNLRHSMEASTDFYRHLQYADGDVGSIEFAMGPKTTPATPSSILFSPQRSPKGPRPAPSTVYTLPEPARIPLPDVPDSPSASILQSNVDPLYSEYYENTKYVPAVFQPFSYFPTLTILIHYSASRNDAEGLTTSLLSAASTSPPPFARATQRKASISSATSSRHCEPAHSFYQEFKQREPDPWVSQAQECVAESPEDGDPMPEAQAAHSGSISGNNPQPSAMAGSELEIPAAGEERGMQNDNEERVIAEEASRITFSTLFRRSRNPSSNEHKPAPASQHTAPLSTASAISDLSVSVSKPQTLSPLPSMPLGPITIPVVVESQMPSLRSKSSVIGSFESSNINIGESVTWEKVEGINDEWTELSNPREEVVAMSESDDSELDDDDDEWEASRRQTTTGITDSTFLPSVERRRRAAAQQQHVHDTNGGNATPKGKRTPTTSFTQNGGMRTGGCAYEAYNNTPAKSTLTTAAPMSARTTQKMLTPQQEKIVADMQRARTRRGIGIVPGHAQNSQRIVSLTSDW